jgi:SAM-dependent methyltransferase
MNDLYYKSRYVPNPTRPIVWKEIVRYLKPFLAGTDTVLDLGAGYCDFINNVSAPNRIAVDMSDELVNFAGKGVRVIQSPVTDLGQISDSSVDVAFASNLLEHLDDQELKATISEVRRVLRKGGLFIAMQPNYRLSYKRYFDDHTHKKVFSDESLGGFLVNHGFEIVLKKPKFLPFSLKSRSALVPAHPLVIRAYINSPIKPFAGQMLFVARK